MGKPTGGRKQPHRSKEADARCFLYFTIAFVIAIGIPVVGSAMLGTATIGGTVLTYIVMSILLVSLSITGLVYATDRDERRSRLIRLRDLDRKSISTIWRIYGHRKGIWYVVTMAMFGVVAVCGITIVMGYTVHMSIWMWMSLFSLVMVLAIYTMCREIDELEATEERERTRDTAVQMTINAYDIYPTPSPFEFFLYDVITEEVDAVLRTHGNASEKKVIKARIGGVRRGRPSRFDPEEVEHEV